LRILIVGTVIIYLLFSILYLFDPTISWRFLIAYIALIPFQVAVILVLERFILATRHVDQDVLFAAVTVYLLIGAIFVPVYGIIELVDPGAILDKTIPGTPIVWQQLIYFSFVTLTTTGYGDILPVAPWARVFANAESAIGVFFGRNNGQIGRPLHKSANE
jgi:hypothetical protein